MDAAGAVQGVDAGRGALAPPSVRGNLDPRLQSEGQHQRRLASASSLESCSEENANERSSPGDLHLVRGERAVIFSGLAFPFAVVAGGGCGYQRRWHRKSADPAAGRPVWHQTDGCACLCTALSAIAVCFFGLRQHLDRSVFLNFRFLSAAGG